MLCTYVGARQAEESIEPLGNGFTDGYKVSYVGSWNTTLVLCMRSQCLFLPRVTFPAPRIVTLNEARFHLQIV